MSATARYGRSDALLATVVLAGVILEATVRDDLTWRPAAVVFGGGLTLAVLLRRAHPLAAVTFAFGGFAVLDVATFAAGATPVVLHSGWEDVLGLVARGRTNAEIARELHISMSTVKFHLAGLMAKIGARNRVELALWAYQTRRIR